MSTRRQLGVVTFIAVCAYAWTPLLEFQLDDYWVIPTAGAQLRNTAELLLDPVRALSGPGVQTPVRDIPLFQPALWLMFVVEQRSLGGPAKAWLFHAVGLLTHAFTAMLFSPCSIESRQEFRHLLAPHPLL